jgi:ubiquitin-protein ligase
MDLEQIYHPNLDLEGNVCLNILREDWKPVSGNRHCPHVCHQCFGDSDSDSSRNAVTL